MVTIPNTDFTSNFACGISCTGCMKVMMRNNSNIVTYSITFKYIPMFQAKYRTYYIDNQEIINEFVSEDEAINLMSLILTLKIKSK